ncbi:hypothetical protein [Micromonospora zamorensis]|uniref:hypothetical protein n=1 Tax=Micromonospora zamorensis TaxID=709883 RepID=UPI0039A54EE6
MQLQQVAGQVTGEGSSGDLSRQAEVLLSRSGQRLIGDLDGVHRLTLVDNRPQAGKRWTDSGEVHDRRGLKHRAAAESRVVPIPPDLVGILRRHVDRFGTADDGRLFRSSKGNVVAASTYSRAWKAARKLALTPVQVHPR